MDTERESNKGVVTCGMCGMVQTESIVMGIENERYPSCRVVRDIPSILQLFLSPNEKDSGSVKSKRGEENDKNKGQQERRERRKMGIGGPERIPEQQQTQWDGNIG